MAAILIVDDEAPLRRILSSVLVEHGHGVTEAASGEEAASRLAEGARPAIVLLDISLPGLSGLETMARLRDADPTLTVILMTAFGTIRSAVDAMRGGAFDYLTKPLDNDELVLTVDRALTVRRLRAEVEALRSELDARYGFGEIVGISAPMREVFRVMAVVAPSDETVLVLGESGTGKELVARALHRKSRRQHGPFVAVNCSAIPAALVESEFFGHERGAFTDAKEARAGKFEEAHRGTLFLDEIGDLPLDAQAKLLRALQDKTVTRLGANRPLPADVRIVAATNKNLEAAVRRGAFRDDLYWRLNVICLRLPALRDRGEDLSMLIDHLVQTLCREQGRQVATISNDARRALLAYDWPGNVRELENVLRHALLVAEGATIRLADLPPRVSYESEAAPGAGDRAAASLPLAEAARRASERVERAYIQTALADTRGKRAAAAERLGISRKTLFNKMQAYGLTAPGEREEDPE